MSRPETTADPVRVSELHDGAVWRVVLDAPPGNVLDSVAIDGLTEVARRAAGSPRLKALVIEGEGEHFSYGASVPEHLPDRCADMLRRFHGLFGALLDARVPCVAVVRGRCLGGGLELAAFCQRIVAAPGALLGQPEVVLGVFAPAASLLLPERIGRPAAEELCLSGRLITADEALSLGLVDALDTDPGAAAMAWIERQLLPRSAFALRHACAALRLDWGDRLRAGLARLEALYLDELMVGRDPAEGLTAFLEKRQPRWSDS